METDIENADRRRARWRRAQKARRDRIRGAGKVLLRIWCTPEEAAKAKEAVKVCRRAERLRQLQRRAEQQAMTRHRLTFTQP